MQITKTKTYNQIPLSECKDYLSVDANDISLDGVLTRLLKSAILEAEAYINDDIITTSSVLDESDYLATLVYINYPIYTTNVRVTSIQVASGFGTGATLTTIDPSEYAIEKFSSYTNIRFKSSISGTRILINYTSGFPSIPENIKTAIYMKVAELWDVTRNGYVSTAVNNSKAFERLLQPYVNTLF